MIISVVGSSWELYRAKAAMKVVQDAGHTVANDWTQTIASYGGLANEGLSEEARTAASSLQVDAVYRSDGLWLLMPQEPTIGAWWECGIFDACAGIMDGCRRMIVSGPGQDRSIFTARFHHRFETDEAAAVWILESPMDWEYR